MIRRVRSSNPRAPGFDGRIPSFALIHYLDNEQEQARFAELTQAFMDGVLHLGDIIELYLEFFPRPLQWKDFDRMLGD